MQAKEHFVVIGVLTASVVTLHVSLTLLIAKDHSFGATSPFSFASVFRWAL